MKSTTEILIDRLSPRDREVLRATVADKIEQLLPATRLGMDWRPTFVNQVERGSRLEATIEEMQWATAHAFILREE